jgi:hypothetical protein
MSRSVRLLLSVSAITFFIGGCAESSGSLSLDSCGKNGNFCHKNINFGPSRGVDYEMGIKDGCTTAEGTFTKNYYMSGKSKDYFDGWILGRSKCKQILPNEGTRQEEENSRKRAEYEINQLRLKQNSSVEDVSQEEGIVDSILNDNSENSSNDVEY